MNKYGLKREIPESTKRAIRRECGFGCVVCGEAIVDYHHFDPPFARAREHTVSGIALLCGSCHTKVTRGTLSNDTIKTLRSNPVCLTTGRWQSSLDTTHGLTIVLGSCRFEHPRTVLRIFGEDLLSIREPEGLHGPVRVSACFYRKDGTVRLRIEDNIIRGDAQEWDARWRGSTLTVNTKSRVVPLKLRLDADNHTLHVLNLEMYYNGVGVVANPKWLSIDNTATRFSMRGIIRGADTCIDVRRKRASK